MVLKNAKANLWFNARMGNFLGTHEEETYTRENIVCIGLGNMAELNLTLVHLFIKSSKGVALASCQGQKLQFDNGRMKLPYKNVIYLIELII